MQNHPSAYEESSRQSSRLVKLQSKIQEVRPEVHSEKIEQGASDLKQQLAEERKKRDFLKKKLKEYKEYSDQLENKVAVLEQ